MNLLEIRTQAVKLSGRYDMVVDTVNYADNGMDFYVRAGQNMLDKMGILKDNDTSLFIELSAGDYSISFQPEFRCMSIMEVWANNGSEKVKLEKVKLKDLKEYYSGIITDEETGTPLYYSPASIRALEAVDKDTLGNFLSLQFLDTNSDFKGIILAPPADENYIIEVYGKFAQSVLTNDDHENYWTLNCPGMLVKATLFQLYSLTGRNTDANKLLETLAVESAYLDMTGVEEDIAEVDDMGD
jgi:hypothetical protein